MRSAWASAWRRGKERSTGKRTLRSPPHHGLPCAPGPQPRLSAEVLTGAWHWAPQESKPAAWPAPRTSLSSPSWGTLAPPLPLSALSTLSPLSSRPPGACHFWSSPRSHLPACTWLSPLGGLAGREARVAAAHHPPSRGLLTLQALPQLADVAEEGGSIECALPGERGIRPPHLGPKTWRPIRRSSKTCRPKTWRPTKITGRPDHPPEADGRSSQP